MKRWFLKLWARSGEHEDWVVAHQQEEETNRVVTVSFETAAETEARLRRVIRETSLEWLPGAWRYVEEDPGQEALAMVVADGQQSWLTPSRGADEPERLNVFRARFLPEAENSGFVGWLASKIKSATGSGVVVVCGYDHVKGGVFDYWGVPELISPSVRALLVGLSQSFGAGLDGVVMRVVEADANAQIGPQTLFCFDERDGVVTARYGGGAVTDGWLAGRLEGEELTFSYLQVGRDAGIRSGRSTSTISVDEGGQLELTERFVWDGGDSGVNRLRQE